MNATATPMPPVDDAKIIRPRAPDTVMRLARMGSFHATRLSFMRALLRRMKRERWVFDRPLWRVDDKGVGVAVYRASAPANVYTLVAFAHDLPAQLRTDRVIAEAWDATFVLHDGDVSEADIERLAQHVPRQEAGRLSRDEIVLSRANRSVRLFDDVIAALAGGRQPEREALDRVGYLMRTTAVYGNGKFGLSDRERIADRPEFRGPFQAEMLCVWLIRAFTVDIVEHLARVHAPDTAVALDRDLRRRLGVGNATGLGMAPFIVHHPCLLDRWMSARETALARVRSLPHADAQSRASFLDHIDRARAVAANWRVPDAIQSERIDGLEGDLARLHAYAHGTLDWNLPRPFDTIHRWAEEHLGLEAQEMTVTLLLEPHGTRIDELVEEMGGDEEAEFAIDGEMTVAALRREIRAQYAFALDIDFEDPQAVSLFWYVSEEKLEPRLGHRFEEPGAEREQPLTVARDVAALERALETVDDGMKVRELLLANPEFRHVVRRVQICAQRPYSEIRDNLLDAGLRPIDLLRCKLSFFGATRFDPKSDRWVRITLFPFAPYPDDFDRMPEDEWGLPPIEVWPS